MEKIKINSVISQLLEKSVLNNHRSMFFLYGKHSTEQVMLLYHMLISSRSSHALDPPSVLWCFKKKLFTTFNEKRVKKLCKMHKGSSNPKPTQEDIFDHFIVGAGVHFCHYSESSRVLGQTFGLVVLQDFSALSPNTVARIMECVGGGGVVVFLLPDIQHPRDLFAMPMDAHNRFVTEAFPSVSPLFNRRLVLSLSACPSCLILDDQLQVRWLPEGLGSYLHGEAAVREKKKKPKPPGDAPSELRQLLRLCRTRDQRAALLVLSEALSAHGVVSLTSARGRGKSAVLGLSLALGLAEGCCRQVVLSSPHLENLQTLFCFTVKGLKALDLKEGSDFSMERSGDIVSGVEAGKWSVRYLPPREWGEGRGSDLVVLDEAAAVPLPLVKKWVQSANRVFMASTVNGYEGTGRSLSLKLISQLRNQSANGKKLWEVELSEAVRYADGDPVEHWLDQLLCLHPPPDPPLECQAPRPQDCHLYRVERDRLFGGGALAEGLLQRLVGLFVSSHYNNSPNDLLMLADAPAHALFCLLTPGGDTVLCVIQVAFEGEISAESCRFEMSHGRRASGDMIPWVISQQFQDHSFTSLRGARVVRIATRADCQGMGYGRYALDLLAQALSTRKEVSGGGGAHLLTRVQDMARTPLDYLGVSYGLTPELFRFWKKCGYIPLYIRQTTSEVTGEHTCMMVKGLQLPQLASFYSDFVPRFLSLVATAFRDLPPSLVLDVVSNPLLRPRSLNAEVCQWLFPRESLLRLASFCSRQVELAAVADLFPSLSRCHLMRSLSITLPVFHERVLVSVCLQGKSVDTCAGEVSSDSGQVMGALGKALLKILNGIEALLNKSSELASAKRPSDERSQNSQRHKKFKNFH